MHENKLAKVNDKNLYTATTEELPDTDPRKYEQMYLVQSPNYQFGMEMSASFTQTPNGLDNWGHDIIYEFTGDDDFWLYVDGELVIDLGGIHSALPGNINFSTGDVSVNGEETTLYEIFKSNYKSRNPDKTDEEVNTYLDGIFVNKDGKYLFEDYSTHDLKIFFMERGGGASNLHTKFNLSSVRPGQVTLYKELSGTEDPNFRFAEYGYQIFYQMQEGGPYIPLDNLNGHNKHNVIYDRTNIPVKFTESYTPDGCTQAYEKVFFLTPEQTAIITIPTGAIRYKIVECGVDPQIYDKVQINEEEIQGISAENGRKDYGTSAASITERQRVVFNNHVKDNAERTLTFVKKLYDADDNPIENDNTGFDFRLYLGKETDTAPAPANTHDYYIKTPEGEYCKWNSQQQNFESIGKTDFSTLSETEKESITFQTSPNGAISKIPAGLQVEVRGLIIGTKYKIEEREAEIPEGYSFIRYKDNEGNNTNAGSIKAGEDPSIEIHNRKGYGLTVKKQWSDTDYVNSHDNIFFGIYVGDTLVEDTVKCFSAADKYKYWYFDSLQDNKTLSDYLIKEVKLSGNYTIENGNVRGNFTAVPVDEGNLITVGATLKNDTRTEYDYSASYRRDTDESSADNIRTDTVTNTRRGIKLIKTDFNGNPLQNAVFTLKDDEGNVIGGNSYTSDASGLITIAYIRDNKVYTLEETKAPKGYVGAGTIKFKKSNGIVTVTEGNDYQVVQTQGEHDAEIRIKNKPFELKVVKKGFSEPLEGAGFELYKEIISGGTPFIDFTPMDGYTNLVSNSAGVIPKVNETLNSGTYYLKETSAPAGYEKISQPVRFVISETGQVTVNENSEVVLSQASENNVVKYTITITDKEQTVIPTGIRRNGILIMLILTAAMYLFLRKRTPGVSPEDRNNSF